ncbi:MAG: DUF3073 domain-containing protein [Bifidobacterium sp.]|nr:DUF3073 domain-containing protein [Bifidobacterium sp.]
MGRGRQKVKQQKIARKLKYLTTDTDYDELAKELGAKEPGAGSFDPFADVEERYEREHGNYAEDDDDDQAAAEDGGSADDLDEYAAWAAESAAKATSGEMRAQPAPKPHKPIRMPVPGQFRHEHQD